MAYRWVSAMPTNGLRSAGSGTHYRDFRPTVRRFAIDRLHFCRRPPTLRVGLAVRERGQFLESSSTMDLIATEVMRQHVQTVPASMPLPDLERAFVEVGVSGFAVVEGDQVVGVVSRTDIVRQLDLERQTAQRTSDFYRDGTGFHEPPLETSAQRAGRIGERMEQLTVRDVMHHQLFAVSPEQPLRAIAETMVDNDIHRVLVTREGKLQGVISTTDFVRLYAQGRLKPA